MGTPASRRGIRRRGRGREKGDAAEKKKKALYACKAERSRGIMVGQSSGDGDRERCRRHDATGPIWTLNPFRVPKSHSEFFTVHRDSGRNATASKGQKKAGST